MSDLVQWLGAQLDEDERIARAADGDEIEATEGMWGTKYLTLRGDHDDRHTAELPADLAEHVAAHDPARVLREIDAKRKVLADFAPELAQADATIEGEWNSHDDLHGKLLAYLALPYTDRPGYREEWRP